MLLIYQKNKANEILQSKMSRNSPSHQCGRLYEEVYSLHLKVYYFNILERCKIL